MKAMAFTGPRRAELLDWPDLPAQLQPRELDGRTLVSLTSPGTELNGFIAERKEPGLSGYATVFEVERVGADVANIKPGDRVFHMGKHVSRQRCEPGGCVPLPAGLAPELAVFARLMCVSWTTFQNTTARPPDRVLVTGLGIIGNLAAQVFQAGGYRVTAVDPAEDRRQLARTTGLCDVRAAVPADITDFGLAVECSGHEQAVLDCCKAVRKRGEVALVGVPWRKRTDLAAFDILHAVFHRYVVLRSGWEWEAPWLQTEFRVGSILGNLAGAVDWLAQGRINVAGLYRTASPSEAQSVWDDLLAQRGGYLAAVFKWA
ncbi:MAG: L-threonine 3-dehydrogenase [Verrucomicrobiae bacterium]|nr:L-threonine 3-dehydrogenase [Verrucomicrobiae bacterium]